MNEALVVLITAPNMGEAEKIARLLLEKKLAACCNLVSGVRSLYQWDGKIGDDAEVLLIVKTKKTAFERLKAAVVSIHSYKVPEVIALPVTAGHQAFLEWIDASVHEGTV